MNEMKPELKMNLPFKFSEMKGALKQHFGKLTDDDMVIIEKDPGEIPGKIQRAYGYSKERALQEFHSFKQRQKSIALKSN